MVKSPDFCDGGSAVDSPRAEISDVQQRTVTWNARLYALIQ